MLQKTAIETTCRESSIIVEIPYQQK